MWLRAGCVQVLRLWEATWAAPTPHFHMWCVLAVLQQHRRPIMDAAASPDGILKYCIQVRPPSPPPSSSPSPPTVRARVPDGSRQDSARKKAQEPWSSMSGTQRHVWQGGRVVVDGAPVPAGAAQLAGKLDVEAVLRDAEVLAEHHGAAGGRALQPLDPPPPAPPA